MVRAPCCDKMGLKKGPWTPEEDQILISYIRKYGHGNWRALPKQAGLLRCGKSCRLRWTNYLRPDIKRGNFTKEEEETIIKLHEMIGNRWSAIAAKLPGRTDNEIKNVWHTHLKKRLNPNGSVPSSKRKAQSDVDTVTAIGPTKLEPVSPPSHYSCSEISSSATNSSSTITGDINGAGITHSSEEMDAIFWSQALSIDGWGTPLHCSMFAAPPTSLADPFSFTPSISNNDDTSFWFDLFMEPAGDFQELSDIRELSSYV